MSDRMLFIKIRRDGPWDATVKGRDLDFVRTHIRDGWPDSLTVEEIDGRDVVAALRRGVDALEVLRRVLE